MNNQRVGPSTSEDGSQLVPQGAPAGAVSELPAEAGSPITLVIPGRNAARVVRHCLDAVVPLLERGELAEIIFVDDASTDETATIVAQYPITCLKGQGHGPGAARNLGWREARSPLVWFIDSDCVAEPDALSRLRNHLGEERVAAVGGSYGNMRPDSLLACLIHEEIVERHRRMRPEVNFLATFNVLYRRSALEELGGFDERFRLAQDAELAFRVQEAGYRLRFEAGSRVGHFHPTRLLAYLKTQARQGYYRLLLYQRHPGRARGDDYSGLIDYAQPPLALFLMTSIALVPLGAPGLLPSSSALRYALLGLPLLLSLLLLAASLPLTFRIIGRTRQVRYLWFAPMSFARAAARGLGLLMCARDLAWSKRSRPWPSRIRSIRCDPGP
ncbi:MAG: glycosyltransferase [Isosphaeraceae bacterium]|nr:glycosyltransferase [Isosphaeraceae bacterium]